MKIIKIRTIEEAKKLSLPPIPADFFDQGREIHKRAQNSNMSRHAILREIFALVDRVGELVDPFTVCSSGCSACCTIPVHVTELEASYIERNTGRTLRRDFKSAAAPAEIGRCPLLTVDGKCSVYAYRPFACRVYAAFDDPKLCEEMDTDHVTYTADANAIYRDSRHWLVLLNRAGLIGDIRNFFSPANAADSA